jgi:NAD(P)-dependent dehydrogenase (short-subunit alcohol dehydrogenase family)
MSDFEGKVVLITGAAGGIGRAAAIQFAQQGARVAVADIDAAGSAETVELIGGDAAIAISVDVSDEASCQAMVDETVSKFGRLDILFSNAGVSGDRAKTADITTQDWNRVIAINLTGVFFCSRAAIPAMLNAGGGVIINTASVDGLVGMPTIPHYVAAKHGVIGFTKSVALEYARENIRAVAIAPGYIKTKMTEEAFTEEEKVLFNSLVPLGRPAEPGEVANMVLWLASDKASYVTGTCHNVDAGLLSGFNLPG